MDQIVPPVIPTNPVTPALMAKLREIVGERGLLEQDSDIKPFVTDSLFQPLVLEQLKAIVITLVLAVVGTTVIAFITKAVVGLRPTEDVETQGLDIAEHGEEAYHG